MGTLFKAIVYGTPERKSGSIQYVQYTERSVEYSFSNSIRCVSIRFVSIRCVSIRFVSIRCVSIHFVKYTFREYTL
jgi:hypothetical protein